MGRGASSASSMAPSAASLPPTRGAAPTSARVRAAVTVGLTAAVLVVGLLVARGITHHDGPVLPLALCRAGQPLLYLAPLSVHRAFAAWQGDVVYDVAIGVAAVAYALGIRAYRRRTGRRWPIGRTALFAVGLALLAVTLNSAIAVYDMTLFSAHMIEHLLLLMVVPAFLVLGRPLTMLLELSPAGRLRSLVDRPLLGMAFSAPAALATYVAVIVGTHLTGVMADVMARPWLGQLEHALYLVAGVQFFAAAVGNAPVRWRLSYPGRLLLVMTAMVVDAFVGIVLLQAAQPIQTLGHPGWGPSQLSDTHIGGGLMWVVGDGLMALVPVALYIAWSRNAEKQAETPGWYERARVGHLLSHDAGSGAERVAPPADIDASIDSDEEQYQAYNRWLASLNKRS